MTRWVCGVCLLAALLTATRAEAQYFGQNQVQYRHLQFSVIRTEHFDVHFYEDEREAALAAARMAERAYARLSRLLNHRYRARQPIILFQSHSEFQQNNISPVDESTGGFTEFYRHRVLLPFTGSMADFEHVLVHELVHQFQIDVFAQGRIGAGVQRIMAVNPPLWFMEGMAEYLSSGPITPQTAVWLRDAAIERGLPDLDALTWDPSYFPYRFGHGLWSYIAERWGDEAVGEILHAAGVSGVEGSFRRVLGMDLEELVEDWHDAIQRTYLPQLAGLEQARQLGRPVLTKRRSSGTVHISPAISPDGRWVIYLSEANSYFIDLYLADAETGKIRRRLIRSAFSTDFESLRFLNSVGAWSPDSRLFAFAAKRGGRDDLVIFDIERDRVQRRIKVPVAGIATPTWSPDGAELAFTGFDGGFSDLFVTDSGGRDVRRLTNDSYADLHPSWSPDGRTIAFATDRGAETDFDRLAFAPLSIALFRLEQQSIEVLPAMFGNNTNPQWSPDGAAIAFVSDRTGIPNLFLYEVADTLTYQLSNVFTGVTGVTPLSPVISWAAGKDLLLFTYYEQNGFSVYGIDNPRTLKDRPFDPSAPRPLVASLLSVAAPRERVAGSREPGGAVTVAAAAPARRRTGTSFYRSAGRLRASSQLAERGDSGAAAVSVTALLDSAAAVAPDPATFSIRRYSSKLSPDYVVQPTVGYVRDNFGSGFYGGTAISLSDLLGSRRLVLAGQINGRVDEAQVLAVYANLGHRVNWAVGASQTPLFYYTATGFETDTSGLLALVTTLERYVIRDAFIEAYRPLTRFQRIELGLRAAHVQRDAVFLIDTFDPSSGIVYDTRRETNSLGSAAYVQPSLALVFDNSVSLYVGPFMGRRSRIEYAPAIGGWRFHQLLVDYRRYDHFFGPFTIASRLLFFGRFGRDNGQFPLFLGSTELLRGYTSGSLRSKECLNDTGGLATTCDALEQLIGTRVAVANAELRFPLTRNVGLGFVPAGLPPIEAAVFFDAGVAWDDESSLALGRGADESRGTVRTPLTSWGLSLRANMLGFMILRFDYSKPLSRNGVGAYWTVSIGPTF